MSRWWRGEGWLFDTVTVEGRDTWWDGVTGTRDQIAATVYVCAAVLPLLVGAQIDVKSLLASKGSGRMFLVVYGLAIAIAPHLWLWMEASAFFDWSATKYKDPAALKEARDKFKMHADGVKAVWTGLIAVYAGVLLRLG
jgi:hypothetical protein